MVCFSDAKLIEIPSGVGFLPRRRRAGEGLGRGEGVEREDSQGSDDKEPQNKIFHKQNPPFFVQDILFYAVTDKNIESILIIFQANA